MGTGTLFRVPGCSPGPWASSVSLCAPWVPGCSPDPRVFPGPLPEEGHAERKRGGPGCSLGSARRVQRTRSLLLTARGSPETSAPPQWTVPVNADAPLLTRLRVSLTSVPKALSAHLPLTQGGSEAQAVVEGGRAPLGQALGQQAVCLCRSGALERRGHSCPAHPGAPSGDREDAESPATWQRRKEKKERLLVSKTPRLKTQAGEEHHRGPAAPGASGARTLVPGPHPAPSVCEGLRGRVPGPPARRPTALLRALRQETPR